MKKRPNSARQRNFLILADLEAIWRTDLAEELQESRMLAIGGKNKQNQRARMKLIAGKKGASDTSTGLIY